MAAFITGIRNFLRMQGASMERLEKIKVVGEAAGGMVKAHFVASGKLERIEISPELQNKEFKVLQDLVVSACNDGNQKMMGKILNEVMTDQQLQQSLQQALQQAASMMKKE